MGLLFFFKQFLNLISFLRASVGRGAIYRMKIVVQNYTPDLNTSYKNAFIILYIFFKLSNYFTYPSVFRFRFYTHDNYIMTMFFLFSLDFLSALLQTLI